MLVIFDWDGTLVDSAGQIVDTMQQAARSLGVPEPGSLSVREVIGLGLPEAVAQVFPGLDDAGQRAMCEAYSRSYREHAAGLPPLFPGAEEVLRTLRGQGLQLAVATGKSRRGLNRELAARAMGDYFDTTRCADETRSKPHPQMLHEILGECDRGATDAVMVGDTLHDMAMARSAGVGTVAVTFGAHSGERLRAFGPDLLADDFWSILEWLNQIRV